MTEFGLVYSHSGWVPRYVSSLRQYPDCSVTIALHVNSEAFIASEQSDLMGDLELALAELILKDESVPKTDLFGNR
ncbi:hypothetical protein [Aporhodopirellula aestuarii]|uniref:Uncharacterized protein n=1 Tax=Aporhodopirellula aestuarii TaxID=2950107 RepID=A0ABT0U727_9BACT|nr:hypothetical protein [Aporhodopirellula aestuarii]MCM2372734.1 hypothetical protein [Aporhodopirellula aestuarii]